MKNLAGDKDCDRDVERELTRCKIEIVRGDRTDREVPASITGKLGPFTFRRAWYSWVVDGPMPLEVARELYADPVGKTDVRAGGDAGCRPPETWADYFDADGRLLTHDPDGKQAAEWDRLAPQLLPNAPRPNFVPDAPAVAAKAFVDTYHVDTEIGLRLLVDTIRRYGLDATPPGTPGLSK